MHAEPQKEHRWLQRLVGEWTVTSEMPPEPGAEPQDVEWSETVRWLHGMWVVGEGRGEMPGVGATTTMVTLGYDPRRECYVGAWVGSMMDHMWVYEGRLDAAGKVLTLDTEGPDFEVEGRIAKYQDIITLQDDDHRLLTSRVQGADGAWKEIMQARYRRMR